MTAPASGVDPHISP
ncbi:MAG TPA: hypothetical protein VK887_14120 [Pseudonocardiaceae bacterium]|nr:hypothetical protein [Pseudonocardiaceae bacterium]